MALSALITPKLQGPHKTKYALVLQRHSSGGWNPPKNYQIYLDSCLRRNDAASIEGRSTIAKAIDFKSKKQKNLAL